MSKRISKQPTDQPTAIVTMRVDSQRENFTGAEVVFCDGCAHPVWLSPSTKPMRQPGVQVLCIECMTERVTTDSEFKVGRDTIEDAAQALGVPVSEIESQVDSVLAMAKLEMLLKKLKSKKGKTDDPED